MKALRALVALSAALVAAGVSRADIDRAGMDPSVPPGNDFNLYASGHWIATTQIPADRSSTGVFVVLDQQAQQRTRQLLESAAAAKDAPGSVAQKAGGFYASYMDEGTIEKRGLQPLQAELGRIDAIADKRALARYIGSTLRNDVDPLNNTNFHTDHLFGLWVAPGFTDPDHYTPYLLQGGLGVRSADNLIKDTPRARQIRSGYQAHIAKLLTMAGSSAADADRAGAQVLALEQQIARVHVSLEQSQDVLKANNPWKRADFERLAPGMSWADFFAAAHLNAPTIIVWQPSAITGISKIVASTPLETWKVYLRAHLIDHFSNELPAAFVNERFAFYNKLINGVPQLPERWKRAVSASSAYVGDAVGQLYVKRYFPPASKAEVQRMVTAIVKAFDARVAALTWMADATKHEARRKLQTLYVGIGYPETFIDYAKLDIRADDLLGNVERAERFEYERNISRLGKPVDKHEWSMTPQTVNAVNLPLQNALNFPAAILEPPFFDPKASPAQNFGAIGSVIGHEISHSFDDQGSQFDARGMLKNWWTPQDLQHFREAGAKLVAQYNAYHPLPDASVNGQQTLSENIADVAGLSAAYDAWKASGGQGLAKVSGGQGAAAAGTASTDSGGKGNAAALAPAREFFISYAQVHRSKAREGALREALQTDGHAPGPERAQTVRNLDAWYQAFDIPKDAKLYLAPADRVRVW